MSNKKMKFNYIKDALLLIMTLIAWFTIVHLYWSLQVEIEHNKWYKEQHNPNINNKNIDNKNINFKKEKEEALNYNYCLDKKEKYCLYTRKNDNKVLPVINNKIVDTWKWFDYIFQIKSIKNWYIIFWSIDWHDIIKINNYIITPKKLWYDNFWKKYI